MEIPMIQAFQTLTDSDSRFAAIDALTAALTPYEWRHLAKRLRARTFQTDIVGALPVEIVAHIFAYLDPLAPVRLRAVSTRWSALLRSPAVWKPGLGAWYDGLLEPGLDDAAYVLKARAMHHFRSGRCAHVWSGEALYDWMSPQAFCEDMFAYRHRDKRTVCLVDLRRRTTRTLVGKAREYIDKVTLSDRLVTFYSHMKSTWYVFDVAGRSNTTLRVHPHMADVFASRGPMFVSGGSLPTGADFYVWNLDTQRGTSVFIPKQHPLFSRPPEREQCADHGMTVLPNPDSQTLTVFTSDACEHSHCTETRIPCTIHYARFTLDGHELERSAFTLPQVAGARLGRLVPVDRRGGFALQMVMAYHLGDIRFSKLQWGTQASMWFDETTFTFKDPGCPVSSLLPPYLIPPPIRWWKDTFYQRLPPRYEALYGMGMSGHNDITKVPLAYLGTRYLGTSPGTPPPTEELPEAPPFFLNDKYAVLVDDTSRAFRVVSFQNAS